MKIEAAFCPPLKILIKFPIAAIKNVASAKLPTQAEIQYVHPLINSPSGPQAALAYPNKLESISGRFLERLFNDKTSAKVPIPQISQANRAGPGAVTCAS